MILINIDKINGVSELNLIRNTSQSKGIKLVKSV